MKALSSPIMGWVWCVVVLSACGGEGSSGAGCARGLASSPSLEPATLASHHAFEVLPVDSELLISFKRADLLALIDSPWIQSIDHSMAQLVDLDVLGLCRDSAQVLGHSLCASATHEALGVDMQRPLLVTRYQDHWVWVFSSHISWQEPSARTSPLASLELELMPDRERPDLLELAHASRSGSAWLTTRQGLTVLVVPSPHLIDSARTQALTARLGALDPHEHWRALPAHRALYDRLSERAELILIGATDTFAKKLVTDSELAARQRQRFFSQLERVGLGLWRSPTALNRLDGELRVSTNASEAMFIRALEPSTSTLPQDLGALLSPQTLGVMHAAVEPRSVLEMWRSALDVSRRRDLDMYLKYLKSEFMIDLDAALLDNLTGHLLLVIYEVQAEDPPPDEAHAPVTSMFGLYATHEVLYAPLKDRFALEQLLNALTQISRGTLRRQRDGDIIQYVWLQDDELRAAVLLGNEAMAIVDSAISVSHAMEQLTSPRPLSPEQTARYGAMFSAHKGFGVWVNPSAFSHTFSQGMSQMLSGVTALSLISYAQAHDDATLGADMSMTFATEEVEEPVSSEP